MPDRVHARLPELVEALRKLSSVDDAMGLEEDLCSFELPSPGDPYRSSRVAALDRLVAPRAEAASEVAVAEDALHLALRAQLAAELAAAATPVPALLRSLEQEREEIHALLGELAVVAPPDEAHALATVMMRWIREALLVEAVCRAEPWDAEGFSAARRRRISQLAEDSGTNRFAERLRRAELEWLADLQRIASGYPEEPVAEVWIDEPGEDVVARIDLPDEVLAAAAAGDGGAAPVLDATAPATGLRARRISSPAREPVERRPRFQAFRPTRPALLAAAAVATAIAIIGVMLTRGDKGGGALVAVGTAPSSVVEQTVVPTTALVAPTVQTSAQAPTTTVTTTVPAASPASTTAPAPLSAAVADAVTSLARACPTLPSGSLATAIRPNKAGTGTDPDPRTNKPSRWVGVGWAGDVGPLEQRPPYSVTALLYLPGQTGAAAGPPVDREGAVQLWFSWDGTTRHKGIRRFDGTTWRMALDTDADDLTVAFPSSGVVFYWNGLQPGWSYAMLVATADGCQSSSTQPDGSPAPIT